MIIFISTVNVYFALGPIRFKGDWDAFYQIFKADQLFGGGWFDYIHSWLKYQTKPNVYIVKYEDVRSQPMVEVQKMARFCDKSLTEEELEKVVNYIQNDCQEEVAIGGWKKYFTSEQNAEFDEIYREKMKDVDISFDAME